MTTVVQLMRAKPLPQSNPSNETVTDDFRQDVIAYGALLYDVLKKRRDFSTIEAGATRSGRFQRVRDKGIETDF